MYKNYFPAIKKYNKIIFCDNAGGSQIPYQVLNKTSNFLINNSEYFQEIITCWQIQIGFFLHKNLL